MLVKYGLNKQELAFLNSDAYVWIEQKTVLLGVPLLQKKNPGLGVYISHTCNGCTCIFCLNRDITCSFIYSAVELQA